MMEKEEKNQRVCKPAAETDFFLQWGNRKRLRCVRVRDPEISDPSSNGGRIRRKITSRIAAATTAVVAASASEKERASSFLEPTRLLTRNSEAAMLRSENRKSSASGSPEKEDRYYTTRGSVAVAVDENGNGGERVGGGNGGGGGGGDENRGGGGGGNMVWPKLYISLSSKEKEEDFMAMKGCKPPQRPKKRAKIIQRTLLLVSPGAWLSEMCQERYEVREKKSSSSKKRPRGLKAMGSMESDSE